VLDESKQDTTVDDSINKSTIKQEEQPSKDNGKETQAAVDEDVIEDWENEDIDTLVTKIADKDLKGIVKGQST
jgi:hypothetical protein